MNAKFKKGDTIRWISKKWLGPVQGKVIEVCENNDFVGVSYIVQTPEKTGGRWEVYQNMTKLEKVK